MNDFEDLLNGKLQFEREEDPELESGGDVAPNAPGAAALLDPQSPGGKYRLVGKIGEGGAGEVWRAEDRLIERTVALKRIRGGTSENPANREQVGRFLFEARITARLDHPGIVPVHEIGIADDGSIYYTMRLLEGKTLAEEVSDAASAWFGLGAPDRARIRMRFLQAFISACNAVAFAHSRGVMHRDLKPSNIVLGKFGGAVVIDWGLAKVIAGQEPMREQEAPGTEQSVGEFLRRTFEEIEQGLSALDLTTVSGLVKGTPAFMSPEQAAGLSGALDERSDIYSLGAVLHQVLTFRPPVEGRTAVEILARIQAGEVASPRERFPELDIAGDLDAIVLKAMALRPSDRFESAERLRAAVEAFLEGSQRRERALAQAKKLFAEGEMHVARVEALRREIVGLGEAFQRAGERIRYHDPVERKRPLWRISDRLRAAEIESARAFADASVAFTSALNHAPGHEESRKALCSLYWDRFLAAEAAGDAKDMVHFRTLVERYDDGTYADLLRGDGALIVETVCYQCRCLQDGRELRPEELIVEGYHPISGRHIALCRVLPGLPELEPSSPARLRVHGPGCKPEPVGGADVWLFRYEERDRIMAPVFPEGAEASSGGPRTARRETGPSSDRHHALPSSVLDRLYDPGSPFRPGDGAGLYLGRTPMGEMRIPMGSYLLILHKPGFEPVRVPFRIGRQEKKEIRPTLYPHDSFPKGFRLVSGGAFTFQGDRDNPNSYPAEIRATEDVLLSSFPVTCAEYLAFLNDMVSRDSSGTVARLPREADHSGYYWPAEPDGGFVVPTARWLSQAPPDRMASARRLMNATEDWEEDWPVAGVSWEDAMSFAAWRTGREGFLFSLPLEAEWEKAARGADGRVYSWGDRFDATYCNMNKSRDGSMSPASVDSFPEDESPFGVRGLSGNVADPLLDGPGRLYPLWRYFRGGSWGDAGLGLRAASRRSRTPDAVYHLVGIRLCVRLRAGGDPNGCAKELGEGLVHGRG